MAYPQFLLALTLLTFAPVDLARAQTPDTPPSEQQAEQPPWPVKLGMRVVQVEKAYPLVDRVVLVPDAATYLDELGKWSPNGRWPVLFEDDRLAAMFIRRFEPDEVIRRASVNDGGVDREAVESVVVRAWGGSPEAHSIDDAFRAHQYTPPGVVIASMEDSAWTAAAALAAGRGQPLVWIDDDHGSVNATVNEGPASQLASQLHDALDEQPYTWRELGDDIDTITICRSIAGRVRLPRWDTGEAEPAAMIDYLGRIDDKRFAIAGWIFGDETRSAYMAMCSLFLPRTDVTMYNTYDDDAQWQNYDMTAATAVLAERGCDVTHLTGTRTTETAWLGMLSGGLETDVFVMNTRGNAREMHLNSGKAWAQDVPMLTTPAAVHLTHSWSMRQPNSSNTIGGRWLDRGAYAAVGSMQEPYLTAFIPPQLLAQRWMSGVPFLVGARYWGHSPVPFAGPWKVTTIGDPLMLVPPASAQGAQHKADQREVREADYGTNLRDHAELLMRQINDDPSGESTAQAIAVLAMINRDEIAMSLWNHARQQSEDAAGRAARAALGPLFRARDVEGFFEAWSHLRSRDDEALDMLWHLMSPRLASIRESERLLQMQSAIRSDAPHVDIRRLAPHLATALGTAHVKGLIQRELDRTTDNGQRRELQRLLQNY